MENKEATQDQNVLDQLAKAVYVKSVDKLDGGIPVKGYDLNKGIDYEAMFKSYITTGF